MKPEISKTNAGGGGMSRAAKKKRAKKNKRKLDSTNNGNDDDKHPERQVDVEVQETKKSKLSIPEKDTPNIPILTERVADLTGGSRNGNGNDVENDDDESAVDGKNNNDEQQTAQDATVAADMTANNNEAIPDFGDTPLVELLLRRECDDEQKRAVLENLSSVQRAASLFQSIVDPIPLNEFYDQYWEKKPLYVRATNKKRFSDLLSLKSIRNISKTKKLYYSRDLNVTKYKKASDGIKRRVTLDKLGGNSGGGGGGNNSNGVLVKHDELWANYKDGCTIRLLCPHKHADNVHALLSTLELELQCMVGANAYLTPPKSSQGFAPHYDDIEAFCLQLEGKKRWKVYEPKFKLPRVSSEDFTTEDLEGTEPVLDIILEEGDLLYMPRGWIHQACTLDDDAKEHSLHLTVSAMQQWAWIDLMDIIIPEALSAAAMNENAVGLRQGLPRGFLNYMGAMYEEPTNEQLPESMKKDAEEEKNTNVEMIERKMLQEKFRADAKKKIMKIAKTAHEMIDAACDQLGKRFISDRQPPAFTQIENVSTNRGGGGGDDGDNNNKKEGEGTTAKGGGDNNDKESILPNTLCRLVRPGIARLVIEDDRAVVYHCCDNSREYQGNPVSPLEYEMDDGPALEQLLTTVEPHWIFVNDLFHDTIEDKVGIAQSLYDEGILSILQTEDS